LSREKGNISSGEKEQRIIRRNTSEQRKTMSKGKWEKGNHKQKEVHRSRGVYALRGKRQYSEPASGKKEPLDISKKEEREP
jgi:hypothetical protein